MCAWPGMVCAFKGGLGVGKTTLTKGIARGLGIELPITSPTYTIVNEYNGKIPLYHIDVYRLQDEEEFALIDASYYIYSNGVCVIEWSEKVTSMLPDEAVVISIELDGKEKRTITIEHEQLERCLHEYISS